MNINKNYVWIYFRISYVIYCERPKRVMRSPRTNWFNTPIPCYKSLIPIKMENYNFLKWQSKLYEYWIYDMALAGGLLFIKTTLTFDRLLPVKENFLTRQVFKVSLFFSIEYWIFYFLYFFFHYVQGGCCEKKARLCDSKQIYWHEMGFGMVKFTLPLKQKKEYLNSYLSYKFWSSITR